MMRNPYDVIGRFGLLLAIAGAVNWLLVGLFQWNFVQWLFTDSATQSASSSERIVYTVVGVGGLLAVPMLAATLTRSRTRDLEDETRRRFTDTDDADAAFCAGAPKNEREAERASRPSRVTQPTPTRAMTDASLRYGTVEETDEGLVEGQNERRAA
jgi:uncharacterized protein